jgi:acyl phosphate:glycerol-3-phosphate acyltransferase
MLTLTIILLLSYLVGSIPASVWIGKCFYGVDVRQHGSGNAGATNAFRVLGWKAGVLSTLVDVGKGLLAAGVIAMIRLDALPALPFWEEMTVLRLMAGISAVAGHMYPVWAGFRGGKGVNTSAGVLFALTPVTMLITLGVFALMLFSFRYVSLASMTAAIVFPATVALRKYVFGIQSLDASLLILSLVMALSIVYAHRTNIARLLKGQESRIGSVFRSRNNPGVEGA